MKISGNSYKENSPVNRNESFVFKSKFSKNRADYLRAEIIRKMILRFLSEKQMSKQELAEVLGITKKNLLRVCLSRFSMALVHKINLPLAKLYCRTKF
ncbi:MAG: hypothetical protein WCH10_06355 [bacterium]